MVSLHKILMKGLALFFISSTAWPLITQHPVVMTLTELKDAKIQHIAKIKADLDVIDRNQKLTVLHVITTGKDRANQQSFFIDIAALEQIKPAINADVILRRGQQLALNNEQVDSVIHLIKINSLTVPKWMTNKKQKKYIQIVLQKENAKSNRAVTLSTREAQAIANWAIRQKHLVEGDHPQS